MEVLSRLQPAPFEDRLETVPRRARIGRRFEHDQLPLTQPLRDVLGGLRDDREVRLTLARERSRQGDQDRVRILQRVVVVRGTNASVVYELLEDPGRNVPDVTLTPVDRLDDVLADVDEHDVLAGVREDPRKRHPDVPGSHDGDFGLHERQGYSRDTAATLGT